jgi:hypothetical protein
MGYFRLLRQLNMDKEYELFFITFSEILEDIPIILRSGKFQAKIIDLI